MPCTWRLVACSTSADKFPFWEPMACRVGERVEERKEKAETEKEASRHVEGRVLEQGQEGKALSRVMPTLGKNTDLDRRLTLIPHRNI